MKKDATTGKSSGFDLGLQEPSTPQSGQQAPQPSDDAEQTRRLLECLREFLGHDFSGYKPSTIGRRIRKRMRMSGFLSLAAYADEIERSHEERLRLLKDLLIGVTCFFRDQEAFEALRDKVFPALFRDKGNGDSVRIWIPACSTGEEAYSVAIILDEYMERAGLECEVKILATDIDRDAVEKARKGVYPPAIRREVSPQRLSEYFLRVGRGFAISPRIRSRIVFAPHDVLSDPPFRHMDLVVCRNLMIYLNMDLQRRVLTLFHQTLRPGGYLFLGPSETIGQCANLFEPLDKRLRLFRRKSGTSGHVEPPLWSPHRFRSENGLSDGPGSDARPAPAAVTERILLRRYGQPAALMDASLNVLHLYGDTSPFLGLTEGEMSRSIYRLARKELLLHLRSAIRMAIDTRQASVIGNVRLKGNGQRAVTLIIEPVLDEAGTLVSLLAIFEETSLPETGAGVTVLEPAPESDMIRQLEADLTRSNDRLQQAVEGYEALNEELKASNEELLSMNEELQASNEEMEASREELHALNEELTTLNAELQTKLEELDLERSFVENLLRSSNVATVFLDRELSILRFTQAASSIFHLIPSDQGRPIGHVVSRLVDADIVADSRRVMQEGRPFERELCSRDGKCYLYRLFPYQSLSGQMDGVVLTFVDITQFKEAKEALRRANEELEEKVRLRTAELKAAKDEAERRALEIEAAMSSLGEGILFFDQEKRLVRINDTARRMLGYTDDMLALSVEERLRLLEYETLDGRNLAMEELPLMRAFAGDTVTNMEIRLILPTRTEPLYASVSASPVWLPGGGQIGAIVAVSDIGGRIEAEKALRQSEELYRGLFQGTHAVKLLVDPETLGIVDANPAACGFYGYTAEEFRKLTIDKLNLLPPQEIRDRMARAEHLQQNRFEFRHCLASGEVRDVEVFSGPVNVGGRRLLYSLVHDVTERKLAEERARSLAKFPEQNPHPVLRFDRNGALLYANSASRPLLKYFGCQGEGLTCGYLGLIREAAVDNGKKSQEVSVDDRLYILTITPIPDQDYVNVYGMDITERKQAEEKLRRSEERFHSIFSSMHEGMALHRIVYDDQGMPEDYVILDVNPAYERILGLPRDQVISRRSTEAYRVAEPPFLDRYAPVAAGKPGFTFEAHIPSMAKTFSISVASPAPGLFSTIFEDVTEKRRAAEQIMIAKEAAEAASRAKSEFLANMSHEIRTPLNGAMGMLQLMQMTCLDDKQVQYVHIALESSRNLLSILNDILDLSRVEAGVLAIREEPFELDSLLQPVMGALRLEAEKKGLDLIVEMDPDVPRQLLGDPVRIRQVAFNLVGNAIKYTESGSVHLELHRLPSCRKAGHISLHMTVCDTGIGIPDEMLSVVFQPFIQADIGHTRKYGGAGLGLAIVKRLVDLLDGTITIDSEQGRGTSVHITLCLRATRGAVMEPSGPILPAAGRGKVLVVEDEAINRMAIVQYLGLLGYEVGEARNGQEALDLLTAGQYDLVLMDVQMPVMNGIEATRRIRSGEVEGVLPDIPIIALTAYAMQSERDNFIAQGMSDYLAKPLDMGDLAAALTRMLGEGRLREDADGAVKAWGASRG